MYPSIDQNHEENLNKLSARLNCFFIATLSIEKRSSDRSKTILDQSKIERKSSQTFCPIRLILDAS